MFDVAKITQRLRWLLIAASLAGCGTTEAPSPAIGVSLEQVGLSELDGNPVVFSQFKVT